MAARNPKRGGRNSHPIRLAAELERRVAAYARAAAAAGVGLAVTALPAEAKIVHTRTNTVIPLNSSVPLDLDHDGTADFNFIHYSVPGRSLHLAVHRAFSYLQTNQIWGRGVLSGRFASALPAGFTVRGNKSHFQASGSAPVVMEGSSGAAYSASSRSYGQWLYTKNRYLGLQFVIKGQVHYGWARLSVTVKQNRIFAVLTGYAYETISNKPIITGKTKGPDVVTLDPATLGHLALGRK
jgi:hypothetical protein